MNVETVTNEETGRIAAILEAKWQRMVADYDKRGEELEAANTARDILQKDADYWHARALAAEARGDKFWADMDFMLQQWNKLRAMCFEVDKTIKKGVLGPGELPPPNDAPPSVVVVNRGN